MLKIVEKTKIWFVLSAISNSNWVRILLFTKGLNFGIDF